MTIEDPNEKRDLDSRAVPTAVGAIVLIVLGVVLTYADTSVGAVVVLLGLFGVIRVGWLASR